MQANLRHLADIFEVRRLFRPEYDNLQLVSRPEAVSKISALHLVSLITTAEILVGQEGQPKNESILVFLQWEEIKAYFKRHHLHQGSKRVGRGDSNVFVWVTHST